SLTRWNALHSACSRSPQRSRLRSLPSLPAMPQRWPREMEGETKITNNVRAVGYSRVSTTDQAEFGVGLDAQRAATTNACEMRGWQVAEIFEDRGFSGKNLKRPGLAAAIDTVE